MPDIDPAEFMGNEQLELLPRKEEAEENVKRTLEFFGQQEKPDGEIGTDFSKKVPGPESMGGLEFKELCEEMLAEYHGIAEKLAALTALKEDRRDAILRFMGKSENAIKGAYLAEVQAKKGRLTTDWEGLVRDMIGKVDAETMKKYQKQGEESRALTVKKLSK